MIAGLFFLITGIFAVQLGIDNDPGWGRGRIILAITGFLFCLAAAVLQFFPAIRVKAQAAASEWQKFASRFQTSAVNQTLRRMITPVYGWIRRVTIFTKVHAVCQKQDGVFIAAGVITVLLVAVWFFSAGRLTAWSPGTDYFNRLADGFLAGQLSFLDKPSPELLAMSNPYDWRTRIDNRVPFLWDATLYDGKYYLYWGPVPAMIAAAVKSIFPVHIYDGMLIFSFYTGIVILLALILRHLRRKFFPSTPAYLLYPLILIGGLALPLLYLVIHPNVYETAISSGQFFLLGGLYFLLRSMESIKRAGVWLLAAGFTLGAAVGSRATLVFAVGFLVLLVGVYTLKAKTVKQSVGDLMLILIPLALWAVGLGWYNWARFGNVLQTGWRYQLTGPALPTSQVAFFSLDYILPNLYSYFIHLPVFTPSEFPFIAIPFRNETIWPWFLQPPTNYYYPEPVASILVIVPSVWLIGLPVIGWLRRGVYWLHESPWPVRNRTLAYKSVWAMLLGGGLMLFLPLTVFISSSLRYLSDLLPFLTLLTAFSLWWSLEFFEQRPGLQRLIILLAFILLTTGILIGIFGNFITGDNLFEARNLDLYVRLKQFFK